VNTESEPKCRENREKGDGSVRLHKCKNVPSNRHERERERANHVESQEDEGSVEAEEQRIWGDGWAALSLE
jgi:hypothetical protein